MTRHLPRWSRRLPLCGLLVAAALLASAGTAHAQDAERPNVLMILVDDLKPAFGTYGDTQVHSPNLDALAERGMRFDRAYCNQAVCAPSRNNLLVGQRSTTLGIYSLGEFFRSKAPDAVTLPQYFKQNGYRSEGIGKVFHIGHGNVNDEQSWSVPFHKESPVDYVMIDSTGGQLTREEGLFSNYGKRTGNNPWELPRGAAWEMPDVEDDAYADGRIALEGIRRLRAAKDRDEPFFLTLGFTKPHLPFCAPKKYWDLYDRDQFQPSTFTRDPIGAPPYATKPPKSEIGAYFPVPEGDAPIPMDMQKTLMHGYFASLSYMDAQVGKVIDELERLGMAENTIIVLWGDHGYHFGDHGSWTKHTNYEQDVRIPLMIIAPGIAEPGSASDAFVETVDVFPTLVDLAGLPPMKNAQELDGKSLVPVLKNPSQSVRDHAYHCFPHGGRLGRAIRTDRYRMVEWRRRNESADQAEYELYDYQLDPLEKQNLADRLPEVLEAHKEILAQHPEAKW